MSGMDLEHSTEPLRQIAVVVTAVLTAVGVGLTSLAASLDWGWIAPASVFVNGVIGILAHWVGVKKGRSVVTPGPNVAALLASAEPVVEPADIDTTATAPSTPEGDAGTSLDDAAKAAGLD